MKTTKLNQLICLICFVALSGTTLSSCNQTKEPERPNILFCIADDWGWPHASFYGDQVVKTPAFDRLVNEGVVFENAFVASPSCTPSRNAILTGQHIWRLDEGANLWSTLDKDIPVYPLLLQQAGYFTGSWRKSWGPGDLSAGGYDTIHPAGKVYNKGFKAFLDDRPAGSPFCFWLGASDPHRPYKKDSGRESGIDPNSISVPPFLPDVDEIRSDFADYYYEVQRFDADVAEAIRLLDSIGELENTIIVMTGDNGTPFPRCKANLYDMGAHVPLAVRWGKHIKHGVAKQPVTLVDLAPTFLDFAGVEVPTEMTGKSLKPLLLEQNRNNQEDSFVVYGRERHTPAQAIPSMDGYPGRAIRTEEFLYIINLFPDRWPAGVADGATHPMTNFSDCDNGPTKSFLMDNYSNPKYHLYYDLCFAKRPQEELFDVIADPYQMHNLAADPDYQNLKDSLATLLINELKRTEDPRILNNGIDFDKFPYRASYKLNTKEVK
ncbi:sulfatase [Maribellus sediminis]|uniref:sulfatase family protein n=1 Tax=Maribellus sediminis TaxID=2696285 RepID=UPI0014320D68|nr:sulfatase [Maribellus sediminis]